MEIKHSEITERIKTIIKKNSVSDYYVWTKTNIPRASFSAMINNKSPWKLEQLVDIANLFSECFNWLVFGEEDATTKELMNQINKLKKEDRLLRIEFGDYRKKVQGGLNHLMYETRYIKRKKKKKI